MIDFSKVKDLTIPLRGGRYPVVKIESGGTVLWMHSSLKPISFEVKKYTTVNDPAYGKESFIRLGLYTGGNNLPVKVTYGGITKEVDFNGSINATVFFGTYKGVSDEVETPESGTLTIEGGVGAVVAMVPCITGINNWGLINRIEYKGFQSCKELNISYIPEGITMIGDYAFQNCTAITDIRIPSTVEEIQSYAFDGCTNLNTVRMEATTPPELGNVRVFLTHENFQIIVKAGCGDAYRNDWSAYADYIVEESTMSGEAVQLLNGILRSGVYSTNQATNITALEEELAYGMTATASNLLIEILRNGVYIDNQSANITALETALASGGEQEPDVPVVPDEPDEPHTHSYTATVTTAATCETDGVRTFVCSCGHSYTEIIPATGHNYVDGVCSNCGAADPDADTGGVDWVSGAEVEYTVTADSYVSGDTGAFVPEPGGYDRTDYIYCYDAGALYWSGVLTRYAAFYDINKQYISGFSIGDIAGNYVNVPENAAYFAISASSLDGAVIKLYKKVEPTWTDGESYALTFVEDEYVNKGTFATYSGWKRTDYMNCVGVSKMTKTNASGNSNYGAFYNAEKEYMTSCPLPDTTNGAANIIIPAGACYFIVSDSNANMDALVLVPYA